MNIYDNTPEIDRELDLAWRLSIARKVMLHEAEDADYDRLIVAAELDANQELDDLSRPPAEIMLTQGRG